jgi:hypothetical protein
MPGDDRLFKNVMKTVILVETGTLVADAIDYLAENRCGHGKDEN